MALRIQCRWRMRQDGLLARKAFEQHAAQIAQLNDQVEAIKERELFVAPVYFNMHLLKLKLQLRLSNTRRIPWATYSIEGHHTRDSSSYFYPHSVAEAKWGRQPNRRAFTMASSSLRPPFPPFLCLNC